LPEGVSLGARKPDHLWTFRLRQHGKETIRPPVLHLLAMADRTYIVALKSPDLPLQHVVAATAEVHGEHLVFLTAEGKLAALFLLDIVQSWNVLPGT
jgi:hypothetical protein